VVRPRADPADSYLTKLTLQPGYEKLPSVREGTYPCDCGEAKESSSSVMWRVCRFQIRDGDIIALGARRLEPIKNKCIHFLEKVRRGRPG